MLLNAWIVIVSVALLVVLALLIWALALYQFWPLWCVPLIFIAVILVAVVGRRVARHARVWYLRRRMKSQRSQSLPVKTPNLDLDWVAGLRHLHQSRLGRLGSPLYVLPWFLMLGESTSGKNNLLSQSGLTSSLPPSDRRDGEDTVNWWFLEQGVVIHPKGQSVAGSSTKNAQWKRLLYWLHRSRRREPLNGVLIVVDCKHLLCDTDEQLAEQGQNMRQRLDELVKLFGARLPIYFIVAGAEAVPGFVSWGAELTSVQRSQPFGLLCQSNDIPISAFLDEMVLGLVHRLSELRIEQGMRGVPDEAVFELPERISSLRSRLEKFLLPAFAANPYDVPPLLGGLFLTAQAPLDDGRREGWFSYQLLGQVLPAQRYAYKPVESSWCRWLPFSQLAIIVWLGLCLGAGVLLIYGNKHSHDVLAKTLGEASLVYESSVELGVTLNMLRRLSQVSNDLSDNELSGLRGVLPFSGYVETLLTNSRARFVKLFDNEIQEHIFDDLISENLQHALASGDPRLIAAYVEFFVRRINMLDARLNNRSLSEINERPDLGLLYQAYGTNESISAAQLAGVGNLYANYLTWETDLSELRRQRTEVVLQLDSMALESRSDTWLIAWAEQHGKLPPIRLSEYWSDEANPPVTLPGAYTSQGQDAVLKLLEEVGHARRDNKSWAAAHERLLSEYQADTQSAWYQFIQRFLLSSKTRLDSQDNWRHALSTVGRDDDPYLKLLQRSAERFELIPLNQRTGWASRAVEVNRLMKLANQSDLHEDSGMLRNLTVTNTMGGEVLKGMVSGSPVAEGVNQIRAELAQAKLLAQFQQLMATVTADLQKSDAQAFQVALDTWGYASDPQVKAAPLWEAYAIREKLGNTFNAVDPKEAAVWALATGSLDFSVRYAGQIAACQLQREWDGQLLSVIEGVQDSYILNTLLYGEKGELPAFMRSSVKAFIQRTAQRYSPREALGVEVPLTGDFYAYVSRMQHVQNDIVSSQRRSQVAQASREQKKQALESEEKSLQVTQIELQQKLAMLQATAAVVELSTTASKVNLGARQLPRQTRLSMQCNGRSVVLDNYNFPTSASFVWTPQGCSDVSLEVFFSGFKLVRHWAGDRAFIDFLRTFNGGQHTFTADEFPNQRDLMGSENLTFIQLTYRQQGERDLLERYAQVDQVQQQLSMLNSRLKWISDQLATIAAQAGEQEVNRLESGLSVGSGLAGVRPPERIAWCWRRAAELTRPSSRDVEIGAYDGDSQIKKLESQLRAMGYETRREPIASPLGQRLQKLIVVDLEDTAKALKTLDEIIRKLNVSEGAVVPPARLSRRSERGAL